MSLGQDIALGAIGWTLPLGALGATWGADCSGKCICYLPIFGIVGGSALSDKHCYCSFVSRSEALG